MRKLINRLQVNLLEKYLKKFPVVAVVGARQVGKTTLVRDLLRDKRKFFTLDDPAVVLTAEQNPISFLEQNKRITIDEVQKCPSLLSAIKRIVDKKRIAGQFIITGSANITMLPKISETLAGRIVFVEMSPLTMFESCGNILKKPKLVDIISADTPQRCWDILHSRKPKRFVLERTIFRGGYPDAWLTNDDESRLAWFKGYVRTYLERDVRDLSRIQKLYEYQKFLTLAAFRCAQILNRSNLARDAGIAYTTASHFLDLLLATFQIFLIEPYYRNIGKRLIKAPKLMWNDTGISLYLQGLNRWQDAQRLGKDSFFAENKIAIEIKSLLAAYALGAKLFYWRTSAGAEIDLLIEHKGRLIPIEIKWSENVDVRSLVSMEFFLKDFRTSAAWGIVLYRGKNLLKIKKNIFLVPFEYFF
ncbi:MAG: ATP-binding protein [Candidatus Omnitrophica bacterium]|nr:ATP-binding protein [Candidatus Omnitrophota bacterium]